MKEKHPVKIILDTDIGCDCDDAGAMALLHRLCDLGEAELLAVTHCAASPYVAGCIDAINTCYGRQVPVGINYEAPLDTDVYAEALCKEYPSRFPGNSFGTPQGAPDTLSVLRQALAKADDHSVTFVVIGSLASAARLLRSEPDGCSPLPGEELIERKIARTVIMGGRFTGTWPMDIMLGKQKVLAEWNIVQDISAAQAVCDLWPGELIFSSFEIGLWCVSMREFIYRAPQSDPVRRAYELHPSKGFGRESWDHTAILQAIRPHYGYWNLHPYGRVRVDDTGITTWHPEANGRHTYLLPAEDYSIISNTIDSLVMPK